jgi:hypothetical protein
MCRGDRHDSNGSMSLLDKFAIVARGTLLRNFDLYAEAQARCCRRRPELGMIAHAPDRFTGGVTGYKQNFPVGGRI